MRNFFRNLKLHEMSHLLNGSYAHRIIWIATVAVEILVLAYALNTGNFNPFVLWAALTPIGFCCISQEVNHAAVKWIAKARDKILESLFLARALREAIAAIQSPIPISQFTSAFISLFRRVTPSPEPSIYQISATTPLHFAS